MDLVTFKILKKMNLADVMLIDLHSFEDDKLKKVKEGRTPEEYCWTCTPSLPLFILKNYPEIDHIGYLDADLSFYSDPKPLFDELGSKSILITPHRFPKYLQFKEEKSGKFNVSMVLFKRDQKATDCLTWWRDKCIEWCYREYDNGRLGDQLYLNSWPQHFVGVHVLSHPGAGLAPWNVLNYHILSRDNKLFIDDRPLIFYHFHGLVKLTDGSYKYAKGYELSSQVKKFIYEPYIISLNLAEEKIKKIDPHFKFERHIPASWTNNFQEQLFVMKLRFLRLFVDKNI